MFVHATQSTGDRQKKQFHSSLAQWAGECVGVLTGEWLRACFYEQGWLERSYVIPKPPQCGCWFAKAALLGTSSQLEGSSAFRKISSPDCYCLHDLGAGLENLASGTCWDLWTVFIFRVLRECFKWRKRSTQQRKSPSHTPRFSSLVPSTSTWFSQHS